MRLPILPALALSTLLLPTGAASQDPVELPPPVSGAEGVSAMGSRLVTGADGATYLSWVELAGEGASLCYARLGAEGWSERRLIAEGVGWMINWADYPTLAVAADGSMAATWLERASDEGWSYVARVAVSADGSDWTGGASLHDHVGGPEYGFVSLVPLAVPEAQTAEGARLVLPTPRFGAVWLDSRAMAGSHAETDGHGGGDMALMYRTVGVGATAPVLGPELTLDARTCECCATSAAALPGGGLEVAYRDRDGDEVRDIGVLRLGGPAGVRSLPPAPDRWLIPGCPVNGPSLALGPAGRGLAWFTMSAGPMVPGSTEAGEPPREPAVLFATDPGGLRVRPGRGFGPSWRVDEGSPLGRVATALDDRGQLHVAWLESSRGTGTSTANWMLRRVTGPDLRSLDELPPAHALATASAARSSGFPSLAWIGGEEPCLLFSFTDVGEDGSSTVRVLRVEP